MLALREDGYQRIGLIAALARRNHRFARDGYLGATKDNGLEAGLIRDADANTVVENVKALQKKIDALIVVGVMGISEPGCRLVEPRITRPAGVPGI